MIEHNELRIAATSPLNGNWYTAGWLTVPDHAVRNELQILLHGATYDHRYWDWPMHPQTYSYVRLAAETGHATLAVDRIGSGASSRPSGWANTVAAQADAIGHLVDDVRSGALGRSFDRVVLVGHSLGSILAGAVARKYANVDAVVMTGHLGVESGAEDGDSRVSAWFQPVADDPALAHLTGLVDDAYLTLRAEARVPMFYARDMVDPELLDLDERIKGVLTLGEASDMGAASNAGAEVELPTLVLVGEHDMVVAGAAGDSTTYETVRRVTARSRKNFEYSVVPSSGHNLNLHRNARDAYRIIQTWLDVIGG